MRSAVQIQRAYTAAMHRTRGDLLSVLAIVARFHGRMFVIGGGT